MEDREATAARQRRLREMEDELLAEEADRMEAELIWKINNRLGRPTDPETIERARRQPGREAVVMPPQRDHAARDETARLLGTPANARHLLDSIAELNARD